MSKSDTPLPFMTELADESYFDKHARFVTRAIVDSGSRLTPREIFPLMIRVYTVGMNDGASCQIDHIVERVTAALGREIDFGPSGRPAP